MGKPTGFLDYERRTACALEPKERVKHFHEFHVPLPLKEQREQGARCMSCGVPFCQAGMTIMGMTSGCPLNNLVPEWNDLVYRGNWEQAYRRLKKTNNFPEFTSRVCPALCEAACTCGHYDESVTTKENERGIIEYAYEHGYADAKPPEVRTGKRVAVIGSGPAGLAAADQLNKRGHSVTVYERDDRVGGLLMYGIPNMKLEKQVIGRKVKIMEAEGVTFVTGANVGKDIKPAKLLKEYDRVILACGAKHPRDIKAAGFLGCESYVAKAFGVSLDARTNVAAAPGQYRTNVERVYAAGDMRRGQSLVVWAIREGREVARAVDESLMGYSYL